MIPFLLFPPGNGWIAQCIGGLLLVPPDSIGTMVLPMIEPFPSSWNEWTYRRRVDTILETCWNEDTQSNSDELQSESVQTTITTKKDAYKETMDVKDKSLSSSFSVAATTYGEITSLGARQLFSIMGMTTKPTTRWTKSRSSSSCSYSSSRSSGSCSSAIQPSTTNKNNNYNRNNEDVSRDIIFCDVGCGKGKLIVQTVLEIPRIHTCIGIELMSDRYQMAMESWNKLIERQQEQGENLLRRDHAWNEPSSIINRVQFYCQDILSFHDATLAKATHIYVSSLCFPKPLMEQLETKLSKVLSQSVVVSTLQPFPQNTNLFSGPPSMNYVEMSWNRGRGVIVYTYITS